MKILLAVSVLAFSVCAPALAAEAKVNVLFIAVDDLRPELGCYDVPGIISPNIDALAQRGLLFNRAYCQQAVCSPSRTSLLTGLRPDTTNVYDLETHFRTTIPEVVTLPQYFKSKGWHTQSLGKIFHGGLDDRPSWSVTRRGGKEAKRARGNVVAGPSKNAAAGERLGASKPKRTKPPKDSRLSWEAPDVADSELSDGKLADNAIAALREVKDRPFFLAVGFHKPHLPFVAPKKYYDLYPPEKVVITGNPNPPVGGPKIALHNSPELRNYSDIPNEGEIPEAKARELRRGYYAATTYMDAQLGRLLAELDALGLREKTVIVLWGDHGWQLGEHGMWTKHSAFEAALRAPLILSVPGQKTAGAKTDALVEFVDIYPTLCELAGLPLPEGLEGRSFAPLVENPAQPWKTAAFSQWPKRGNVIGYSMRTDRYRYTEWAVPGEKPAGVELYDHQADPHEMVNLASQPGQQALAVELAAQLKAGWKAALPAAAR